MKTTKKSAQIPRSTAGRPPKFSEERRPITVTLPLRVLESLNSVNPDRAKAITKLVEAAEKELQNRNSVEVVEMAPGQALFVVKDSAVLKSIKGIRLIEIAPTRFLMSFNDGLNVESLEVQIHDRLEEKKDSQNERQFLEELLNQIRLHRRLESVSKEEFLIVKTRNTKRSNFRTIPLVLAFFHSLLSSTADLLLSITA